MNIKLPGNQQKWLEEQVAAGRFGSVDDAVAVAVADLGSGTTTSPGPSPTWTKRSSRGTR